MSARFFFKLFGVIISIMNTQPKRFKGIFFDMGGTLIYPDPERIADVFNSVTGLNVSPKSALDAVHKATAEMDADLEGGARIGEEWWELYFGSLVKHLPLPREISSNEVKTFFAILRNGHERRNLWSHLAEGARELLSELEKEGYCLGIISNSDGRVESQLLETGLRERFSFVIDSFVVKCEKPDPEIFLMALDKSGLSPNEVLFVGDFVNIDYVGAKRVGMSAVIIDPLDLRKKFSGPRIRTLSMLPMWLKDAKDGFFTQ